MHAVLDIALEIYTWIGVAAAIVLGAAAFIAWVVDGTWSPVRAVVIDVDGRARARWIDDEGVLRDAPLPAGAPLVGDEVDLFSRVGSPERVRLVRRAPLVRALTRLAGGSTALAVVGIILSIVILFVKG